MVIPFVAHLVGQIDGFQVRAFDHTASGGQGVFEAVSLVKLVDTGAPYCPTNVDLDWSTCGDGTRGELFNRSGGLGVRRRWRYFDLYRRVIVGTRHQ
jgi:hypothetical protein